MRIGVLTSSRADYSIYLPLLKALKEDSYFSLHIIAFGSHLSPHYGLTADNIERDGFLIQYKIHTIPAADTPKDIVQSMGLTFNEFAPLWSSEKFDLVFCLGDRYEMFAACASSIPFNVKLAHIHGGEQTLGAIDDIFRHSITLMSSLHFTVSERYRARVIQLKNDPSNVYNVGSLSIDNLASMNFLSIQAFYETFNIDLGKPTILITFHPETVAIEMNSYFISELLCALSQVKGYQFVFTMPNADPLSQTIRSSIKKFVEETPHALAVESFGTLGYLSCMKHCAMMLGNSSSGFIEASYFPKYVVNLGDRQKGRILTENIYNCRIDSDEILAAVVSFSSFSPTTTITNYGDGHAAARIISVLKGAND
jgi:GDP/UDP-N,N'-diacetylbacillosamine 2-epimerase (hydrolysing)